MERTNFGNEVQACGGNELSSKSVAADDNRETKLRPEETEAAVPLLLLQDSPAAILDVVEGVDQIGPHIANIIRLASKDVGCSMLDSGMKLAFREKVTTLLDAWMQAWGDIPNADHFLTDALGECLVQAVTDGATGFVEELLRLGADPDYEETYFQIHQADSDTLIPAYRFPADEFQGFLLGSVEESDFSRRPLHVAAERNAVEIVELLLSYGADVDAREKPQNQTALHDAARAEGRFDSLKFLVEMGSDINALDFNGHTALYRTLKVDGDTVSLNLKGAKFLLENDVNLQGRGHLMKVSRIMAMRSLSQQTLTTLCEFVKLLLDHGSRLDDLTTNDDPLLWYCLTHFEKNSLDMVSLLLNHGACNPHLHTGSNCTTQIHHVMPCAARRWKSSSLRGPRPECLDCLDGDSKIQHATVVNLILRKLVTLLKACDSPSTVNSCLDGAGASLELLVASIDSTQVIQWCRNDAYDEAWKHVEALKTAGKLDSDVVQRIETMTAWTLKTAETEPTTLKNLCRHHVRKTLLKSRREKIREAKEEDELKEEDLTGPQGDTTEAEEETEEETKSEEYNWLEWSPKLYRDFESDILSLDFLPVSLKRYLLFQHQ